jgi:hypothetical protein
MAESLLAQVDSIVAEFKTNRRSVHDLLNFDRSVIDFAVQQVESLNKRLEKYGNPQDRADHTLSALKAIRTNDSLRAKYETIANQGVVLLASYFGSALEDLFRAGLAVVLSERPHSEKVSDDKLTLSLSQLVDIREQPDVLIDIFLLKKDISFQDMQSVVRSFSDYLGIEIERNADMDDIIFGQAARHAIVHRGALADARFLHQIAHAKLRKITPSFSKGDRIQFSNPEVEQLGDSMSRFIDAVGRQKRTLTPAPA